MKKQVYFEVQAKALEIYKKANIILTEAEEQNIEVADFGLDDVYNTGLEIVTYVNTTRCCAKELVLLPNQTCPEHRHAPIKEKNYDGKEETFRCRYGAVYLYVSGTPTAKHLGRAPKGREKNYTVWHEIVLAPGQQYTIQPDTLHWFQAGPEGAVVSEFSTRSRDESDVFTDEGIIR